MKISEEMFNIKIEEARESGFKNGFYAGVATVIIIVIIIALIFGF